MLELFIIKISLFIIFWNFIFGCYKTNKLFCGIVGYSGVEDFDAEKIKILLLYNMSRGEDSSGYYTKVDGLVKEAGKLIDNLHDYKLTPAKTLIAHTRYGTTGIKNKENSHPFEYNNVVGCHNGKIENWNELCWKKELNLVYRDMNVDSQVLIKLIDNLGPKDAIPLCKGPIATLFIKKDTDSLYAFRNSERPLYRGKIGPNTYISSIKESLEAISCINIKEFKEQHLYSFANGEITEHPKLPKYSDFKKEDKEKSKNNYAVTKAIYHWAYKPKGGILSYLEAGWYKVVAKNSFKDTISIDYNGSIREIKSTYFKGSQYFSKNDRIVAMTDFTVSDVTVGKEGDIFLFESYEFDQKERAWYLNTGVNLTTGKTKSYRCPIDWFRSYLEEVDGKIDEKENVSLTENEIYVDPSLNKDFMKNAKFGHGDIVKYIHEEVEPKPEYIVLPEEDYSISWYANSGFLYHVALVDDDKQKNFFYESELELVRRATDVQTNNNDNTKRLLQTRLLLDAETDNQEEVEENENFCKDDPLESLNQSELYLTEVESALRELRNIVTGNPKIDNTVKHDLLIELNKAQDALGNSLDMMEEAKDYIEDYDLEDEEDSETPVENYELTARHNED